MKKSFYKGTAVAGVLATSLIIHAQSGGSAGGAGGGAGGGAAGAGAAGAAGTGSGGVSTPGVAGGVVGPGVAGGRAGAGVAGGGASPTTSAAGQIGAGVARPGNPSTIGAAGINQPGSTTIGGSSVAGAAPNTVGSSSITGPAPSGASSLGTAGTLPSTGTFPAGSSVQPGTQPLGTTAGATTSIVGAQAGIPFTSLPETLQQSIQAQVGNPTAVQTISRDDFANGSVFRVTTMQNGVPTEMRFSATGAFLGSTAVAGSTTSAFTPGAIVPGVVTLDTLPAVVQSTVRSQVGNGRIASIIPQGQSGYVVTYDINGRPTTILVGPDGRILRAGTTATGTAPAGAVGTGSATNINSRSNTNGTRSSAIELNDMPEEVRSTLKNELGSANIQFTSRERRANGDVYIVGARTETNYVQLTLDQDGQVIRDTRDIPIIAVGAPKETALDSGIPFGRVPVAVQNAVKAYATASDVRSVNLGLEQGRTIYDVIFMQDGRRDRLILGKDGTLLRREQDVSAALDNSNREPRLAVGDLPPEVRDTIRRQTDNVLVKDLAMKKVGDQVVYSVSYQTNGAPVELLVDSRGAMIVPETAPDAQDPSSPRPAPLPDDGEEVVKVIPAEKAVEASGSPAVSEVRTSVADTPSADSAPVQKVALSDVPTAVQAGAKKLAGDEGLIESINPKLGDAGVLYEVTYSKEGVRHTRSLNKDGVVQGNDQK